LIGYDWTQLHDRVVFLALHPAGARDHTCLGQAQIRSVEEIDLADLGVEGIEAEYACRCVVIRLGDGELELHAVGAFDQSQQLSELFV
jgi:hypothetical protein